MSTSWGPQSRPPGQAGAKEPRRLETGEARQLVRSLPWRCEGACLLVSVPGPQRPLGPAPGQTRLRASDRGTVGPDPRTPSWTRLVRNQGSCGHGPKAWVSTPPARRGHAEPPRASVPPELDRSDLSKQSPWAPVQTQVREAGPQATPHPSWKPSASEDVLPARLAVPTLLKTLNLQIGREQGQARIPRQLLSN